MERSSSFYEVVIHNKIDQYEETQALVKELMGVSDPEAARRKIIDTFNHLPSKDELHQIGALERFVGKVREKFMMTFSRSYRVKYREARGILHDTVWELKRADSKEFLKELRTKTVTIKSVDHYLQSHNKLLKDHPSGEKILDQFYRDYCKGTAADKVTLIDNEIIQTREYRRFEDDEKAPILAEQRFQKQVEDIDQIAANDPEWHRIIQSILTQVSMNAAGRKMIAQIGVLSGERLTDSFQKQYFTESLERTISVEVDRDLKGKIESLYVKIEIPFSILQGVDEESRREIGQVMSKLEFMVIKDSAKPGQIQCKVISFDKTIVEK